MNLERLFGCQVFSDSVMSERLPQDVYERLRRSSKMGQPMEAEVAEIVAETMKSWAIEQGATHYAHWFQPMNNTTAGKHDAFLSAAGEGKIALEFSSKALVKGETDSSSFPSGGLRSTFEARGYTAWDPTSPAFVRDGTLYIPTAFCSYNGEAMDSKTPLLRSMEALSREAVRFLHVMGMNDVQRVTPTVGCEQEYFLVDRKLYEQRLDLKLCGRTLLGAKPPKGQELDDHYCGRIRLRVAAFMRDLDERLWKLGIVSKTKHNEAAPAQHELAVEYSSANIACDNNQLVMETMRTTAKEHGFACLLHEKPFAHVNGSGKHNNYSLLTDTGVNLLDPGREPEKNRLFLLLLCAFIRSVDRYGDLLRMSATCPGNDFRLGEGEAPPAIISIFLGANLHKALRNMAKGNRESHSEKQMMDVGVEAIPSFEMDESDRNRTSPFAFTGNKFEFRMVGSSQTPAYANVVLNTILAESFEAFSQQLEACDNKEECIRSLIAGTLKEHGRILFNGNNYSAQWVEEAEKRGLPIIRNGVDAYKTLKEAKNVALFEKYHVLTPVECQARCDIFMENYCKVKHIEACTLLEMVKRQILPAVMKQAGDLAEKLHYLSLCKMNPSAMENHVHQLSEGIEKISKTCAALEQLLADSENLPDGEEKAKLSSAALRKSMEELRIVCDEMEVICDKNNWPMPSYTDLLHRF